MSRTLSAAPQPGAAEGLLFGAGTGKRGLSGNMRLHRRNVPWGTQVSAGDRMEERAMRTLLPHGKERGNPTKWRSRCVGMLGFVIHLLRGPREGREQVLMLTCRHTRGLLRPGRRPQARHNVCRILELLVLRLSEYFYF